MKSMPTTVVSYRGTWIETYISFRRVDRAEVVSYRGTWIETALTDRYTSQGLSYLIEVRGLKHMTKKSLVCHFKSYLIEVRGLKPNKRCS